MVPRRTTRVLAVIGTALTVLLATVLPATGASAAWQDERRLTNVNSGLCMTFWSGSGERPAYQQGCINGSVFQRWSITDFGIGKNNHHQIFFLQPTGGALCVAARGTGDVPVVVTTCDPGTYGWKDQYWTIINWGGYYSIRNENSGKCLGARGTTTSQVSVFTCDFTVGQSWADQHWLISQWG